MFSQIKLDKMTFAAQRIIGRHIAEDLALSPDVRLEQMVYGDIAISLRQEVYSQHLERAKYTTWATWKDAVREHAYKWLDIHWPWGAEIGRKRWPVQWRETAIDVKALYPKIGLSHERHSVMVMPVQDDITSGRLWIDAKGRKLDDAIHELRSRGYDGREWAAGINAYYTILKTKDYSDQYLVMPTFTANGNDVPLMGAPIKVDRTVPDDTIELRDKDGHIVGKVYNIG